MVILIHEKVDNRAKSLSLAHWLSLKSPIFSFKLFILLYCYHNYVNYAISIGVSKISSYLHWRDFRIISAQLLIFFHHDKRCHSRLNAVGLVFKMVYFIADLLYLRHLTRMLRFLFSSRRIGHFEYIFNEILPLPDTSTISKADYYRVYSSIKCMDEEFWLWRLSNILFGSVIQRIISPNSIFIRI